MVGVANFLWVGIDITRAGGVPDPTSTPGLYLVSDHGVLTEVSRETYEWLEFHLQTVLVTHLVAIGAAGVLVLRINRWVRTGTWWGPTEG